MRRIHELAILTGLAALGSGPIGSHNPQPEPRRTWPCGNPDCCKSATDADFCSRDCRDYYKQNFRAVDGKNVRV